MLTGNAESIVANWSNPFALLPTCPAGSGVFITGFDRNQLAFPISLTLAAKSGEREKNSEEMRGGEIPIQNMFTGEQAP